MATLILRRSSALSSSSSILSPVYKTLALSASSHIFGDHSTKRPQNPQIHNFTTKSHSPELPKWTAPAAARGFHSGRPFSMSAGYAMADLSDDDKKSSTGQSDDGLEIAKLGISDDIVSALARKGITKLFPIQRAVLEPAMQGRDMIGRARTGTGKTLAFGIPIMDKIIKYNDKHGAGRNPMAIVLAPTRELAKQVDKEFYESAPKLDTLCVYGGSPIQKQMSTLDKGVDIVVGTPGRVIDLLKRGAMNLSEVKFVVLDEADQMLNVGFADDVEMILGNIRQEHQTMLFSATMPSWIMKLTQKYLKNPMHIDLVGDSSQKLADGIKLLCIATENNQKAAVMSTLMKDHANGGKCIIFTQTKRDADRLAFAMGKSFQCEALHGDISQNQRERTLAGFREGRINVLVATDVAARGLDVPNVDLVIHYELPNSSEIFVHRSGRTGRAGKKGTAILLYSSNQFRDVKGIEREIGSKFTELPRIAVDAEAMAMFSDSGRGGGYSSFGDRGGRGGFGGGGRGGFGGGSYGGGGRSGGSSYGRSSGGGGGYSSNRSGDFGFGSDRGSGGFGSDRGSGGFGSDRGGGGFGGGSSKPGGFRGFGSDRFGDSKGGFGGFGK